MGLLFVTALGGGPAGAAPDDAPRSAPLGTAEPPDKVGVEPEEPWAATLVTDIVPPGYFQLDMGVQYSDRTPTEHWSFETPVVLRAGIFQDFEADCELGGFVAFDEREGPTERGFGDTTLALLYKTNEQLGFFPAISFGPFGKIPTAQAHKGIGSGEGDVGFRLNANTYWIPDAFYTEATFQAAWLGEEGSHFHHFYFQPSATFSIAYDGLAPVTIYLDTEWAAQEAPHEPDSLVFSLGTFFFPRHWIAFDMGVDIGAGEADPEWGLYFSVLWLIGPIWGG